MVDTAAQLSLAAARLNSLNVTTSSNTSCIGSAARHWGAKQYHRHHVLIKLKTELSPKQVVVNVDHRLHSLLPGS